MHESDGLGMKVEAVRHLTIEAVAKDGGIQPFRRSGMNAQLMRAACLGIEHDARDLLTRMFLCPQYLVQRHSLLPAFMINLLPWKVVYIRGERQRDSPLCATF